MQVSGFDSVRILSKASAALKFLRFLSAKLMGIFAYVYGMKKGDLINTSVPKNGVFGGKVKQIILKRTIIVTNVNKT